MALTKLQQEFIDHLLVKADTHFPDYAWAEHVGISKETPKYWVKQPEFKAALEVAKRDFDAQQSHFGRKTWQWHIEEALMGYKKAKEGFELAAKSEKAKFSTEMRQWWDRIDTLSANFAPQDKMIDYSGFKDSELWDEIMARELLKGDPWTESMPSLGSSSEPEPVTQASSSDTASATPRRRGRPPRNLAK